MVPAAADGPKGLALIGLDKAIFGDWLPRAPRERWLIGASIGAWRMTAACRTEPHRAFDRLVDLYCDEQDYTARPSAAEVTTVCKRLVERLLDGDDHAVLAHPHHRLAVLAVRGRGPLASDHRGVLLGWGMAAAANALGRRNLARFMDRGVFATESAKVPYFGRRFDAFRNQVTPLDRNNLHAALLASASIPVVLQGVTHIAGAPAGTYWDGGIIDYQLALPYAETRGLVLYPHYIESVTPGWLDKPYPKRRVRPAQLDNVVMVGPSREFISRLPASKLPDRSDFKRYASEPKRRGRAWREVADASHALGEAFLRWCEKPDLALVRGFDEH
ncbi:MAG: hypothetical protein WDN04_03755 [Rhodospirillales bacterium]